MNKKIVAIIQARMGSTRLPGKVLKEILGKSLLELELERIGQAETLTEIIVGTTTESQDEEIVELCNRLNVLVEKGSSEDVLDRYYQIAKKHHADIIVRITADCPLIDPTIINEIVVFYLNNSYDYVSNTGTRTYPRGMDVEVFSFKALKEAAEKAQTAYEHEHVTPYIYKHFKTGNITSNNNQSHYRLTVDTIEDFELISKIFEELYPKNPRFSLNDVVSLLQQHPELETINAHIKQKTVEG